MKCRLFEGEMCSTVEQLAQERAMATFVEFPVEDGGTLLVAVNDVDVRDSYQPTYRGGGTRDVVERSTRTMEAAVERIRPAARAFVDAFTQLPPAGRGVGDLRSRAVGGGWRHHRHDGSEG